MKRAYVCSQSINTKGLGSALYGNASASLHYFTPDIALSWRTLFIFFKHPIYSG